MPVNIRKFADDLGHFCYRGSVDCCGLLGFYGAINLIPTDLGLAYFSCRHAFAGGRAGDHGAWLCRPRQCSRVAPRRHARCVCRPAAADDRVFAPQPEPVRGPTPSRDVPLAGAAMAGAAVAGAAVAGEPRSLPRACRPRHRQRMTSPPPRRRPSPPWTRWFWTCRLWICPRRSTPPPLSRRNRKR